MTRIIHPSKSASEVYPLGVSCGVVEAEEVRDPPLFLLLLVLDPVRISTADFTIDLKIRTLISPLRGGISAIDLAFCLGDLNSMDFTEFETGERERERAASDE